MKKLVSIFLALALILSISIPVFAEGNTQEVTLTVNSNDTRYYEGHQLLELLSMSLKDGAHANCDGTNHKADCYNYAYKVVDQYKEILQEEVAQYAGTNFWGNITQPATNQITDDDIARYLSTLTSDSEAGFGTMRKVADRIYRAIKTENLEPEAEEFVGTTEIAKGYWIFADVTPMEGEYNDNSLVIVKALTQENITLTPKVGLPTLTKKVQDIEDSENPSIDNMEWLDSADHDIGDKVPFKLTATLPSNVQYYDEYTLTFHDKLAAALQLCDSTRLGAGSFKVFMYSDVGIANADYDLNAGIDVTNLFRAKTPTDDCTFELTGNIYDLTDAHAIITPTTAFVVYYEAELLAGAELGNPGNLNTAYLEFSNDPYDSNSTGKTEEDKVVVFTYSITVNKVDQNGNPLPGAGFTLYKKIQGQLEPVAVGNEKGGENSDMTEFTWTGLDDGDYVLKETTIPEGFNGMAPREFSIIPEHKQNDDNPTLISLRTTSYNGDIDDGSITFDVINRTGAALPETGAEGTFLLIAGGTLLVVLAAVFMITRKKMSIYED